MQSKSRLKKSLACKKKTDTPCSFPTKVITSWFTLHYFTHQLRRSWRNNWLTSHMPVAISNTEKTCEIDFQFVTCPNKQIKLVSTSLMQWSRHIRPVVQIHIDLLELNGSDLQISYPSAATGNLLKFSQTYNTLSVSTRSFRAKYRKSSALTRLRRVDVKGRDPVMFWIAQQSVATYLLHPNLNYTKGIQNV